MYPMHNKNAPECSIIIRSYNEEKHIEKLFAGIMEQTNTNHEIILVDSGSTDTTLTIASKYPIKTVYIAPEDFSFGKALNKGCKVARGKYLVFISAHCWPVYNNWLECLLAPLENPDVALTYGKQRGDVSTRYSEHQIFSSWFPDTSCFDQGHPFCNNANCAIRRDIWEVLPYNEDLTGLEDLDWAKRAMAMGYRIAYSAEAEVTHVHDETPERIYNRYRREAIALKQIIPSEHFTFWDFIRLFPINVINDCWKALMDGALIKNLKSIIQFRYMQFKGTYRGFTQSDPVSQDLKRIFYYPNGQLRSKHEDLLTKGRSDKKGRTDEIDYEVRTANEKYY